MNNFEIELNSAGIIGLMKDAGVADECVRQAENVRNRASGDYIVVKSYGKSRVRASVISKNKRTNKLNLETNDLLKALG